MRQFSDETKQNSITTNNIIQFQLKIRIPYLKYQENIRGICKNIYETLKYNSTTSLLNEKNILPQFHIITLTVFAEN